MDVALDRCQPPTVYAVTPHDLHQRNAQPLLDDARVRLGIAACFPGCQRLEIGLRAAHHPGRTRREKAQIARAALEARLREELLADPRIQQIQGRLGARLQRVAPPDEAPEAARREKQR